MQRSTEVHLAVFAGGFCSLGLEMAASRLLNSYFGSSQIVWAVLIGMVLLYLTAGYYLGGRLADRSPRPRTLFLLVAWAGAPVGLIPFVAQPILRYGQEALDRYLASLLVLSLFGVVTLLSVPTVMLGCVSPFATRLVVRQVGSSGRSSGAVYAVSTVGSLLGTFAVSLVLIPTAGTRSAFLVQAALLVVVGLIGLARTGGLQASQLAMLAVLVVAAVLLPGGALRAVPDMIHEQESPYNYIQVVERRGGRLLYLNEGQGIHSVYRPDMVLTGSVWDLFLLAPYFNPAPYGPEDVGSLCLIGLAGGTIAKQYTQVYGPIPIDGAELDPDIIEVGRRFFDMNEPNLNAVAADGRYFLAHSPREYDVIIIDAYRPPYIPPHLTTVEFFQEADRHLTELGVVAINVGRSTTDDSLVRALASTMAVVFPDVYVVDLPLSLAGLSNSMVVGTRQDTDIQQFQVNLAALTDPRLVEVARRVQGRVRATPGEGQVFTDDHAPVEQVVHRLILDYLRSPSQ
ncbi:MAG: fused MFS/spermidine synthase [Anaerolineae bacterium]|nr:fused MFS/spermidine synthase [Anaerolineae bacterium]